LALKLRQFIEIGCKIVFVLNDKFVACLLITFVNFSNGVPGAVPQPPGGVSTIEFGLHVTAQETEALLKR